MCGCRSPRTSRSCAGGIIRALLAIAVGFALCYGFAERLFAVPASARSARSARTQALVIGTGVTEAFFTKLKVSFIAGDLRRQPGRSSTRPGSSSRPACTSTRSASPCPFVARGDVLLRRRRGVLLLRSSSRSGSRFFLEEYTSIGVAPQIRISEYLSFTSRMLLAFGVTFELPVVTFFLARIGLVTHRMLIGGARYAIVVIFIVAAVLTPGPDVASQLLMATPLLVLYALSIGVAYLVGPAGGGRGAGRDRARGPGDVSAAGAPR